jgi:S1-C subfamily serine protease
MDATGTAMFADAVARISRSIFPIFFLQEHGEECVLGVCGTGFFVDDSGLFITADHFMTPTPTGCTHLYYGLLPDEIIPTPLEIEPVASDASRDVFVGRVACATSVAVEFSRETVRPGAAVCLSGYPMAVVVKTPEGKFSGNVRRYWQPSFAIDATRTVIGGRTYDGYIVQQTCLPGMSGGPVFDTAGLVCGMAVATLSRTIPMPDGSATVVSNGIVADNHHIRGVLDTVSV